MVALSIICGRNVIDKTLQLLEGQNVAFFSSLIIPSLPIAYCLSMRKAF